MTSVRDQARRWLEEDPDPETRRELQSLVFARDEPALADRFSGRLAFGTAGLRGAMGAGPNRMNRATVRYAAAGLARYLVSAHAPDERSVVVGYDARHNSHAFAVDSARVLAAAGIRTYLFRRPLPTPVLAFAVRHLSCAAGVMVTASHNPARDNGYKVYAGDGAQIVPPIDTEIASAIASFTSLRQITLADEDNPLIVWLGEDVVAAYVEMGAATPHLAGADVNVAYTPLHGVGLEVLLALFARAGLLTPAVVQAQAKPDPDFPTVPFPNPEEPGAMDLVFELAEATGADIALANDPDADRLAVGIREDGAWRRLTGDEVGGLLADHLLRDVPPASGDERRPLVCTTIVSSRLLSKIAARVGAEYAETLTGFKWLARPLIARPDLRGVIAYEEALGYAVGGQRDKDGMTAALVLTGLAAQLKAGGSDIAARLREIEQRYGAHVTGQWSMRREGPDGPRELADAMAALRRTAPKDIAGRGVVQVCDFLVDADRGDLPATDAVAYQLDGDARVVVRPSGTEPKAKVYAEVVAATRAEGVVEVAGILDAMKTRLEEGAT